MRSPWVRHEASQAIARGCYAPARLEPMTIESPYDRLQATDLDSWDGDPSHPGFVRLLARVRELLPPPVPTATLILRFLNRSKWTIASFVFAVAAVSLLIGLTIALSNQLKTQQQIASDVRRTLQPLDDMEVTAFILINPGTDGVADLVAELRRELGESRDGAFSFKRDLPLGVRPAITGQDGSVRAVAIVPVSSLWPKGPTYHWLSGTLNFTGLSLAIRRRDPAVDPDAPSSSPPPGAADLSFDVGPYDPDGSDRAEPREPSLQWEPSKDTLTLQFTDRAAKRFWTSTGKVSSVPDLEDSAITVRVDNTMFPSGGDRSAISKARADLELSTIFLRYSGRNVMMRASAMHAFKTGEGLREYRAYMSTAAQR